MSEDYQYDPKKAKILLDDKAWGDSASGPRVTVYKSANSTHLGGHYYSHSNNPEGAYKVIKYQHDLSDSPSGGIYGEYGQHLRNLGLINFDPPKDYSPLTSDQFNQLVNAELELIRRSHVIAKAEASEQIPFNEHNPGNAVNVMWPVVRLGTNSTLEAGMTIGQYRNSYYRNSTYLAGSLAYHIPKLTESGMSASLGVEAGRITGYKETKYVGQAYGELCQEVVENLSACLKVGVMPTRYEVANVDKLIGQDERANPKLTYDKKSGAVVTKQIGISYRF